MCTRCSSPTAHQVPFQLLASAPTATLAAALVAAAAAAAVLAISALSALPALPAVLLGSMSEAQKLSRGFHKVTSGDSVGIWRSG